jgi:hypothetical protein
MLNGIAPIIIFDFIASAKVDLGAAFSKIPVLKNIPSFPLPSIPIYLDENLTGLVIDSTSKNVDINTEQDHNSTDPNPVIIQKGINSLITLNLKASQNSLGMTLLSVLCDTIFSSLLDGKYSITYLHSSVTLFGGLLHSFSTVQNSENDLFNISLQLSKGKVNSTIQTAVAKIAQPFNGIIPGVAS